MSSAVSLAWRTLTRRPQRLVLFVAGVAVAAAMLLDMVMLSAGLERSLRDLLEATGYQVRATPRGFLPFETRAVIPDAGRLTDRFRADPRVAEVAPMWGQTVYAEPLPSDRSVAASEPIAAFGVGIPAGTAPTLRMREGRPMTGPGEVVIGRNLADVLGLATNDSLRVGIDPDPAIGGPRRGRTLRVSGIADFVFAAAEARSLAMRLEDLWALAGAEPGTAALILVRVRADADPYAVARDLRAETDAADIYAIPEIIEAAGDRLTYFSQLSLVLGTVSLIVTFLLVATLLTLSVNDRWGEIATLRAIGVTRGRMLAQIAWQGLLISAAGAAVGLLAGLMIARWLDTILTDFPGLPVGVSFFVLRPLDAARALTLVLATGLAAGLYPAWRAASVNIAGALRKEMA